jgi:hypothetical protein
MPRSLVIHRTFTALLLSGGLYSAGCTSVYKVNVDAVVRANAVSPRCTSFRIEDKSAAAGDDTLRHREVASHVATALSAHGLFEAPDVQSADMVVEVSYGMGPPRVERTVYQELVNGRPRTVSVRHGPPPEGVTREMMGYTQMAFTTVRREKHLSICARENPPPGGDHPPADLWQVHVSIDDASDDLRGQLPVLASVAMDYIGHTTSRPEARTLRSDDEAIQFIRKGL